MDANTLQKLEQLLVEAAELGSLELALAVSGVTPSEMADALKDEGFKIALGRALASVEAEITKTVISAARKGDAGSARWYLERTTRRFAPPEKAVTLNVSAKTAQMSDAELLALALGSEQGDTEEYVQLESDFSEASEAPEPGHQPLGGGEDP